MRFIKNHSINVSRFKFFAENAAASAEFYSVSYRLGIVSRLLDTFAARSLTMQAYFVYLKCIARTGNTFFCYSQISKM